jgi:hypothetical protein
MGGKMMNLKALLLIILLIAPTLSVLGATPIKVSDEITFKQIDQSKGVLSISKLGYSCVINTDTNMDKSQSGEYTTTYEGNNIRIYEIENGLEYEIILNEAPKDNLVKIPITFDNRLKLYYQQPLNELYKNANVTHAFDESGNVTMFRPMSVVGSYAVYCDKVNNEYKIGKLFHLYRPLLIDAKGKEVWLDYKKIGNTLFVILPDLNGLEYPIIIDPTLGYTSIGASYDHISYFEGSASMRMDVLENVPSNITITEVHFYGMKSTYYISDQNDTVYWRTFLLNDRYLKGYVGNYYPDQRYAHQVTNGQSPMQPINGTMYLQEPLSGWFIYCTDPEWHNSTYAINPILEGNKDYSLFIRFGYYATGYFGLVIACDSIADTPLSTGSASLANYTTPIIETNPYNSLIVQSYNLNESPTNRHTLYVDYTVNPISSGRNNSNLLFYLVVIGAIGISVIMFIPSRHRRGKWK